MHLVHVCASGCIAKLICYISWPSAQEIRSAWPVGKGMTSNWMITGDNKPSACKLQDAILYVLHPVTAADASTGMTIRVVVTGAKAHASKKAVSNYLWQCLMHLQAKMAAQ